MCRLILLLLPTLLLTSFNHLIKSNQSQVVAANLSPYQPPHIPPHVPAYVSSLHTTLPLSLDNTHPASLQEAFALSLGLSLESPDPNSFPLPVRSPDFPTVSVAPRFFFPLI